MTLSDWTDLVQTAVVVFGGYIAWRGIDSWRHEMLGRRRAEVGEETLAMFYEAQNIIEWVRFPASLTTEGRTRPLSPRETEQNRFGRLDAFYVPVERLNNEAEFWSRFDASRFRFRALFGDSAVTPFQVFKEVRGSIQVTAGALIRASESDSAKATTADLERRQRDEGIIWGVPSDKGDTINADIAAAISVIENICRPAIEGYNSQARDWWKWPKRVK